MDNNKETKTTTKNYDEDNKGDSDNNKGDSDNNKGAMTTTKYEKREEKGDKEGTLCFFGSWTPQLLSPPN